jgi:hypothetical protein
MVSGDAFERVCHFEKTALILPIRVIYFHFKVHTTVTCGLLQHTRLATHSPKKNFEVNHNLLTLSHIARSSISLDRNADSRFGQLPDLSPRIWCICCSAGPLLEAGRFSGTISRAKWVPVPIALLRSSLRRSGSIFIAFEVTTFGYRSGKICSERAISLGELPDPDLYYLRLTLHYICLTCAPHRPGRLNGRPVGITAPDRTRHA